MIFGCKKDSDNSKLKSVLSDLAPKEQTFTFYNEDSVSITGKKGTKIYINLSDLVKQDGTEVTDSITVSLLELTSIEELLKSNTQTISDDKWLISGGVYKIGFYSQNNELKLKENAEYQVVFPKISDEKMSIFYGSRDDKDNMNWELSDLELKEKLYPVVILLDTLFMRYDRTYQIDLQFDSTIVRKPKDKFTLSKLKEKYPQIDSLEIVNDTIIARDYLIREELDSIALANMDSLLRIEYEVYEAISINKMGWINIDRFYPEINDRVTFDFELSGAHYNQCYIVSRNENTILNEFFDNTGNLSISFPKNKTFEILVFKWENNKLLGVKKRFMTNQRDTNIKLEMEVISNSDIESYFKLN